MYSAPNDPGLHNPSTGPRIKLVIALLLEQHADVNVVTNNVTCFTVLMRAKFKHWDIIELLIAHGARDDLGSLNGLVLSKEEKKHISELLRTRPSKRPPRPCPCFSRRLLSDCHGKGPKAFPCHFICPCQSGVAYAKCCKKRDIAWREVWNGEQGIIEPWRKDRPVDLPLPMHTTTLLSKLRKETGRPSPPTEMLRRLTDVPLAVDQIGLPPEMPVNGMVLLEIHLNVLLERGLLDPGFVFAVKKASWNARPLGRKIPKKYATDLAQGFNKHVDEYINSGLDSRKAMEIEMASKLGPSCGALYRVCEAQGCKEQEGRRLIKLKYCQKCRMAVYCSLRCQRAHWKVHKTVCCAPFQTEQPLSSQRELQESLSQSFMEVCSILIQQIQDNEPNLIPQLFPEGIPEDYAIEEELAKEFDTLTTREILEKFGFLE
ncbi:hypothetical protein BD410DRAFT_786336 [Rickenella mellea]|uniref:MYND-type domain-containing protein n=1 Tax=Rickenella mellea TaxID=50990 RepID=A0A4Y7QAC6_9AGAM|nr:hypothetical protein BD410DRAFT_786336 [Rickenella mellea]